MIHPNMATMFGFLTTDAPIASSVVRSALKEAVDCSFNMLTIDGDTSPSDTAVLLANGVAGGREIDESHPALPIVCAALRRVAVTLSRMLASDGEGAGKLLEIEVSGARSVEDARSAARTIGRSPLVKSAVYGNDPNWGRVVVALGYSGVDTVESRTSVHIQGVTVYRQGCAVPFDLAALSEALKREAVHISVELGLGDASATCWGCDLTPEYVRINSEYTT
jgi:glutamate N-acetyltransferase/amino-acid N-acetyltransferase